MILRMSLFGAAVVVRAEPFPLAVWHVARQAEPGENHHPLLHGGDAAEQTGDCGRRGRDASRYGEAFRRLAGPPLCEAVEQPIAPFSKVDRAKLAEARRPDFDDGAKLL